MADKNAQFARHAHPMAWLQTAVELHEQAIALVKQRASYTVHHYDGEQTVKYPEYNRAAFLLGGFALENLLKSFLIYENPHWISNGTLARNLRTHSLTSLQAQSMLVPYKRRLVWVLSQFEQGLDSWSRYPCALSADDSVPSGILTPKLWDGYLRLTGAYGNKLRELLSKMWVGPHGTTGRAEFRGEGTTMGRQNFKRLGNLSVHPATEAC